MEETPLRPFLLKGYLMTRTFPWGAALALLGIAAAAPAAAGSLDLPLPEGPQAHPVEAQRTEARYQCDGLGPLRVDYVTAGPISLAVLPLDGQTQVFAQVLSGSGARYAAGPYMWWVKGTDATLQDLRKGEAAPPVACKGLP